MDDVFIEILQVVLSCSWPVILLLKDIKEMSRIIVDTCALRVDIFCYVLVITGTLAA